MEKMGKKELIEKAKQTNSPEELLVLAKENDYPLSKEDANIYFEKFHKSGELSDEELDNVAGGGCDDTYCPFCGGKVRENSEFLYNCPHCHKWI